MSHKKIAKKWRLISLAKQVEEGIAYEFLRRALELEDADKILEEISFECGRREGEKIRKALEIDDPIDLIEMVLMLSGVKYKINDTIEIYDCFLPVFGCIPIKVACRAFLRGVSGLDVRIVEGVCDGASKCVLQIVRHSESKN
jgi:predicted hydrocarbon binding protein